MHAGVDRNALFTHLGAQSDPERVPMSRVSLEPQDDGLLRSAALKLVRRHSGLSTRKVASGMHLPLRTYEHFEAGHGRLNLDYIHRFCAVTDSDPYAVLLAIWIGSPAFALRAADNKFMNVFTILLQAADTRMGDRLRDLDARTLIAVMGEMFDRLGDIADQRAMAADTFLQEGRADLSARRPRPGR